MDVAHDEAYSILGTKKGVGGVGVGVRSKLVLLMLEQYTQSVLEH